MTRTFEARRTVAIAVDDIILSAIQGAKELQEFRGANVEFNQSEPVQEEVIPQVIHTALVNLLLNAAESHSRAQIRIYLRVFPDKQCFVIEVHDDGPGIPKDSRVRVFEPRYTTKPFNSGMGLVAVNSAVHIHGGSVLIDDSEELGGACVKLVIPFASARPDIGISDS